jgi:hypothetical protein
MAAVFQLAALTAPALIPGEHVRATFRIALSAITEAISGILIFR